MFKKDKYFQYWNDLEIEKKKPYYITSEKDFKLFRWLREESNLERCFRDALAYSFTTFDGSIRGYVLDIGAGVCWSSAIVANLKTVKQVTAIDISNTRLNLIAPIVLKQFNADPLKIRRIIGDFLKWPFEKYNDSFDVVIFCQSAYMFPDLVKVMRKVSDILKPGGHVVIVCEKLEESLFTMLKKAQIIESIKRTLMLSKFFIKHLYMREFNLFKKKVLRDSSGRYSYIDRHYKSAILNAGLICYYQALNYPLVPKWSSVPTGNYFGIKPRISRNPKKI